MDYADSQKQRKITWSAPKKADRPQVKPKTLKDLITSTMSRHGIGRQVTAGMIVERMNMHLKEHAPDLAQEVRVISFKFNELKIGVTHRIYQEKARAHEKALQEIASELNDKPIKFRYQLLDHKEEGM